MAKFSNQTKENIAQMYISDVPMTHICKIFKATPRSVKKWANIYKEQGQIRDKPRSGRPRILSKDQ